MQLLIDATLRPLEAKVERKEECLILKSHDISCSPCISGKVVDKTAAGKESGQQTARCAANKVFG